MCQMAKKHKKTILLINEIKERCLHAEPLMQVSDDENEILVLLFRLTE